MTKQTITIESSKGCRGGRRHSAPIRMLAGLNVNIQEQGQVDAGVSGGHMFSIVFVWRLYAGGNRSEEEHGAEEVK